MTKQDFVDAVATKTGLSRRDAGTAVDAVIDCITDALRSGGAHLRMAPIRSTSSSLNHR